MTAPISASLLALQGGGFAFAPTLFMYGALIAIFYFVLIRPQQKQRRAHEALIRTIKRGDEVVTAGGIIGEVVNVVSSVKEGGKDGVKGAPGDGSLADRITIKSGESRLVIERGRIARVISASSPSA